ncbi:aminopeptidase N-like [Diadema setosum]|uniref:aminopeptidase N-like n=1 Tax=Diadema setosum TaxID=31175 RepID=UPI003B3A1C26
MASERLTTSDCDTTKCDFEMSEVASRTSKIITVSKRQVAAILSVFLVVVVVVGVLCFYQAKRECGGKHGFSNKDHDDEVLTVSDVYADGDAGTTSGYDLPGQGSQSVRLPRDVIPLAYDLHIQPYIDADDVVGTSKRRFTFDGSVAIRIRCDVMTDQIAFHLSNLTITNISVQTVEPGWTQRDIYESMSSYNEKTSIMRIQLVEALVPGNHYDVLIEYIGEIRDALHGFYRSTYTNEQGRTFWLANTQFEPVDARLALPCFDEPDLKAVFDVKITHRQNMVALSNGRELEVAEHGDGWMTTTFDQSPIMSTYLLAFAVGVFEFKEVNTTNGVRLRVWSRPEALESTSYALNAGQSILTYFENYFAIPYPISKLDMIGVPMFAAGAMENWGLIIYNEDNFLYDEEVNGRRDKQATLTTVSHEIAHQWFGNLVTMKWWDDLWLNEGFGTYFGYLGAEMYEPDLRLMEAFLSESIPIVMMSDSLSSSHPIQVAVDAPDEIHMIFDDISYTKGAAVLRMLHNVLGEEEFRRGIQIYLHTFNYSNAESTDLWNAFTMADRGYGNTDVRQVMESWTRQMGYPVVNLTRLDRTTVLAQQRRFLADREEGLPVNPSNLGYVWNVYLTHTDQRTMNFNNPSSVWINDQSSHEFKMDTSVSTDDWYLANINGIGFFRVNYDTTNWVKIARQLNTDHTVIPLLNRVKLLDDAFALAINGDVPLVTVFDMMSYLSGEFNSAPWSTALHFFIFFRDMLGSSSAQGPYEEFLRDLTRPLYQRYRLSFGSKFTSSDEKNTREVILPIACKVRNPECVQEALSIFQNFMESFNVSELHQDSSDNVTMETVLCVGIREGSTKEWSFMRSLLLHPKMPNAYKKKWLSALTCSLRPWEIKSLLEYVMAKPNKLGILFFVLPKIASTPVGRSLAWDFLRENWDGLYETYQRDIRLPLLVRRVTANFNTDLEVNEIQDFMSSRDLGSSAREFQQAVASTKLNIAVYERLIRDTTVWLKARQQSRFSDVF